MKHIKKFEHAEDYNKLHKDGGMIDVCPAISYIDELQTVRYEDKGGAGTIVMANSNGDKRFLTIDEYRGSIIKDKCNVEGYSAIGVIVVPASHTKNGKARMIALKDLGEMPWSDHYDEIPSLRKYYYFSAVATDAMLENGTLPKVQRELNREEVDSYDYCWFASDAYNVINPNGNELFNNPYDTQTYWLSDGVQGEAVLPSPYLNDGSKNPIYHKEYVEYDGVKVYNALANLDGKGDTKKIVDFLTNDVDAAPYNCYAYSTVGTNQGDWYLPSVGELGYLFARSRRINAALQVVGASLNTTPADLYYLWSSSEIDSNFAWSAYFDSGFFNNQLNDKTTISHVVPFCEIEA